jgi:hypothetical protein
MKVLCRTWAGLPTDSATAATIDAYLALDPVPEHAVFHVRLGLSVAEFADDTHDTRPVVRMIERSTLDSADAYAAREARTNPTPSPLTDAAAQALDKTVQAAGLGIAPTRLLDNLMRSVQRSETALTRALATDPQTPGLIPKVTSR